MNHYILMVVIMILSGLLTTMNVWVDKVDDMRLSLNDVYMIMLMSGWMFLLMGLYDGNAWVTAVGICLVALNVWCIRTQFAVSPRQYIQGMIPHHSMAVHMSRKLLDKPIPATTSERLSQRLAQSIIKQQEDELEYMKQLYT